jgi:hypothetical protein
MIITWRMKFKNSLILKKSISLLDKKACNKGEVFFCNGGKRILTTKGPAVWKKSLN